MEEASHAAQPTPQPPSSSRPPPPPRARRSSTPREAPHPSALKSTNDGTPPPAYFKLLFAFFSCCRPNSPLLPSLSPYTRWQHGTYASFFDELLARTLARRARVPLRVRGAPFVLSPLSNDGVRGESCELHHSVKLKKNKKEVGFSLHMSLEKMESGKFETEPSANAKRTSRGGVRVAYTGGIRCCLYEYDIISHACGCLVPVLGQTANK